MEISKNKTKELVEAVNLYNHSHKTVRKEWKKWQRTGNNRYELDMSMKNSKIHFKQMLKIIGDFC